MPAPDSEPLPPPSPAEAELVSASDGGNTDQPPASPSSSTASPPTSPSSPARQKLSAKRLPANALTLNLSQLRLTSSTPCLSSPRPPHGHVSVSVASALNRDDALGSAASRSSLAAVVGKRRHHFDDSLPNSPSPLSSSVTSAHSPTSPPPAAGADNGNGSSSGSGAPYQHGPVMILPGLYLGSEKNASSKQVLVRLNIGFILNVGIECRNHFQAPANGSGNSPAKRRQKKHPAGRHVKSLSDGRDSSGDDESSTTSSTLNSYPLSPIYNPLNMVASSGRRALTPSPPPPSNQLAQMNLTVDPPPAMNAVETRPELAAAAATVYRTRKPLLAVNTIHAASAPASTMVSPAAASARPTKRLNSLAAALTAGLYRGALANEQAAVATQALITSPPPPPPLDVDVSGFVPPQYLHLPWRHSQDNLLHDFPAAFAFIDAALEQKGELSSGVLVHCKQGVSRSASLVIGYVMRKQRMRLNDAYALVKQKSPNVTPNLGLIYQLLEFEREVFKDANGNDDNDDAAVADSVVAPAAEMNATTDGGSSNNNSDTSINSDNCNNRS